MTLEQLQTKLEELEELVNSGKDYARAETQAQELLKDLPTIEDKSEVEIGSLSNVEARILLALSDSLLRRGMSQEALPIAEQALALAEQAENKALQAKAWSALGNMYRGISDYPSALEYFEKALAALEELGDKSGAAAVFGDIGTVYLIISDYPHALKYYGKALAAHEELGNERRAAVTIGNIGLVYISLADYPRALEYLSKALATFEEQGNKSGVASVTGNIGNLYLNLSDTSRALEYMDKALVAHKELGEKNALARVTGNIGNVYLNLSDYSRALEYYSKALATHEELGDKGAAAEVIGNMGEVYNTLSDYPRALEYFEKALLAHEQLGAKSSTAQAIGNIGNVYANEEFEGYDTVKAEEYLLKAIVMNEELGAKRAEYEFRKSLSEFYEKQKRWEEFAIQFKKFYYLEKEVQSEEAKKQAEKQDTDRKLAIERATAANERKILNNILPEEITTRLIKGENPIADHFESVSILFMDIVDFTKLSTTVTARQLVHLLNNIFTAADGVMREFGLEKIKTIGDAYMAVAGAPVVQENHAQRAAQAALKLLDVMQNLVVHFPEEYGDTSWIESLSEIQVRIGLHCGSAAAGVVGQNKFLYDLWGDAVNTASRMESHGEAGKIHVSEEFLHSVGTENFLPLQMRFIERGEIDIKGKGTMRTYFLKKA